MFGGCSVSAWKWQRSHVGGSGAGAVETFPSFYLSSFLVQFDFVSERHPLCFAALFWEFCFFFCPFSRYCFEEAPEMGLIDSQFPPPPCARDQHWQYIFFPSPAGVALCVPIADFLSARVYFYQRSFAFPTMVEGLATDLIRSFPYAPKERVTLPLVQLVLMLITQIPDPKTTTVLPAVSKPALMVLIFLVFFFRLSARIRKHELVTF